MKSIIPIQIVVRSIFWSLILSSEIVLSDALKRMPPTYLYYVMTIGMTTILFMAILRFEKDELVRDINELCFYNIFVQWIGLILYLFHYSSLFYIVLSNAVLILKFGRLLWFEKNRDKTALVGWPIFGLIGFFKKRTTAQNQALAPVPSSGNKLAYVCIFASVPLAYWLHRLGIKIGLNFWATMPLIIILVFYKPFIAYLKNQHAQYMATEKALAVAEVRAQLAEVKAAFADELAVKNAELGEKNTVLRDLSQQRAAMLADLANRNELLRNASHDLKQPVMWINYCIAQLEKAGDGERATMTMHLREAVDELSGSIETTIHNAKITTAVKALNIQPLQVQQKIDYFDAMFSGKALEKGLYFGTNEGDFAIATDNVIFTRIMNNLIANAIQSTDQGGVAVRFRKKGALCQVSVWDTGSGIADAASRNGAANFEKLTTRLAEDESVAQHEGGHGIGLSSVKSLCAVIGATMTLRSRVGVGSVFRFNIPVAD